MGGVAFAGVVVFARRFSGGVPRWLACTLVLICMFGFALGFPKTDFSPKSKWRPNWKANAKSMTEIQQLIETRNYVSGKNWQSDCAIFIKEEPFLWIYDQKVLR